MPTNHKQARREALTALYENGTPNEPTTDQQAAILFNDFLLNDDFTDSTYDATRDLLEFFATYEGEDVNKLALAAAKFRKTVLSDPINARYLGQMIQNFGEVYEQDAAELAEANWVYQENKHAREVAA